MNIGRRMSKAREANETIKLIEEEKPELHRASKKKTAKKKTKK